MFNHHTKSKGDLAIFKSQLDLYEKGYTVLLPLTEHAPFDLVAYKDYQFLRIQVKHRHLSEKGTLYIKFSNSYSTKHGVQTKPIDKSQVDYYCVYCPETDLCYYIRPMDFEKSVTLRVTRAKNNQVNHVVLADNYLDIN